MRSRYAAFAARQIMYLYRTLHPAHEDRRRDQAEGLRAIAKACQVSRYQGLRILDHDGPDESGLSRVLFLARVFQKGKDLSFVERSEFRVAEGGWRYLRGDLLPLSQLGEVKSMTLARFAALI